MKPTEAHAAIRNALQFLGPLVELEKVAAQAADAEKYLTETAPRIQALRQEEAVAQGKTALAKDLREKEEARLAKLYREGVLEVQERVNSVEVQMGKDLQREQERAEAKLVQLRWESDVVTEDIHRLTGQKTTLLQDVQGLQARVQELRGAMKDIASRAGG